MSIKNIKHEHYPAYKDSEVQWIGEIPLNWEIRRVKFLFSIGRGRVISQQELVIDGKYPVYSSQTQDDGVLGYVNTYDFDCKQITWTTDGANAGTVFLREGKHNCTNVCGTLQPRGTRLSMEYLSYALKVSTQFYKRPDTNGAKIMNGEMAEVIVTLPPLPEQTRIASFLDQKTAQIEKAIAQKERLIELLKERRQILIHKAVTRGLNPNVRMKDSGVEWIGEVPEHWEVKRLKYFSTVQSGITLGKTYGGNKHISLPYLRVANVQAGYLDLSTMSEITIPISDVQKYLVRKKDILVTEGGDIDKLGRGTMWQGEIENCLHQNHIFAIRINSTIATPEFVEICLGADYGRRYFTNTANKTTNLASTNSTKLGNFPVAMPTLSEQYDIVNHVANLNKKIGAAIACKQAEIEKLKEYKATLINSAVTGKIKIV